VTADPSSLYRIRDELYAPDMLIAALRGLDFFTWLDTHPGTIEQIAAHFGFHHRPVDVMTTLFVAMGLIERDGQVLRLSDLAREHLVSSSPSFMGPYYPRVTDRPVAGDLLQVLATDRPARFASRPDEADWHKAMESEAFAEEFIAAMDCRGRLTAEALAVNLGPMRHRRLLDVAGGSGIFACTLVRHFPELRASVLEKPPVDRVAATAIRNRGCDDRVEVIAGDILSDAFPGGHDLHLFSNVLHDWGVDVVRHLLGASARALPAGGEIVIHETFLNRDKTGPLDVAGYSVLLMHVSQGRCYGTEEMAGWLREAGFSPPRTVPGALGRSALVASKA
jgi:acetylserotonin N-methyltransferase